MSPWLCEEGSGLGGGVGGGAGRAEVESRLPKGGRWSRAVLWVKGGQGGAAGSLSRMKPRVGQLWGVVVVEGGAP